MVCVSVGVGRISVFVGSCGTSVKVSVGDICVSVGGTIVRVFVKVTVLVMVIVDVWVPVLVSVLVLVRVGGRLVLVGVEVVEEVNVGSDGIRGKKIS